LGYIFLAPLVFFSLGINQTTRQIFGLTLGFFSLTRSPVNTFPPSIPFGFHFFFFFACPVSFFLAPVNLCCLDLVLVLYLVFFYLAFHLSVVWKSCENMWPPVKQSASPVTHSSTHSLIQLAKFHLEPLQQWGSTN